MFIQLLILLYLTCINCISNNIFYNQELLNKQLNVLVLNDLFYYENNIEKLTSNITLHYQEYTDKIQFDNYLKNNSIDSIITYRHHLTCKKNELTQHYYNRSNIHVDICNYINDKKLLRDYLSKYNKINKVSSVSININNNLIDSIKNISFDNFIIKPSTGAASSGIFNIYRKNNTLYGLEKFMKEYYDNNFIKSNNKFVVEEFIEGTEHNLDIVIYNDKVYFWHISDDIIDSIYFQDTGSEFPTRLNNKQSLEMYKQTRLILKYLNIKNGIYHFEFKFYNNKAYLIELNPRKPGGNYVDYIEKLYGSNLVYDEILISLNKEPYYNRKFIDNKPTQQICDREYYAHILDNNSIGTILLSNITDYDVNKVNIKFYNEIYKINKNGNAFFNAIYIINTNIMKDACKYLEKIKKPKFVSIYQLPNNLTINKYDIYEILNENITTVKRLNTDITLDISKVIKPNNKVYLYSNNYNCSDKLYNCLYIPNLL